MRLRYSPASPYVRKVMVLAHEAGIVDRLELVTTDVWGDDGSYRAVNPLGKVPVLETDEGMVLFDSPVICAYLNETFCSAAQRSAGAAERWAALRLEAAADGILDASVLQLLESRRDPAQQSQSWIERQKASVDAGLGFLGDQIDILEGELTIGVIGAACALGYRDFRFPDQDWRTANPRLADWYARFSERASMQATVPRNA